MEYCEPLWRARSPTEIVLTDEERNELTKLARSKLTSVRLAQRARIVLLAADGLENKDDCGRVGVGRVQVGALARALCPSAAWRASSTICRAGRRR